jgi:phosphoenolpyruvate-protein kinase (PTS system EI component)
MSPRVLRGLGVNGGSAVGLAAVVLNHAPVDADRGGGPHEEARALEAFRHVAEQLARWAELARRNGWHADAEILDASYLIAIDPVLAEGIAERAQHVSAEGAVREAVRYHAAMLESTGDTAFSERASDVRELGNRVLRQLSGTPILALPQRPVVVIANDLGPADIAELRLVAGTLRGLALAQGAATSHVAIMARTLGLPFVVGLGGDLLTGVDGRQVLVDGSEGVLVVEPAEDLVRRARHDMKRRDRTNRRRSGDRVPLATVDGRRVQLLCNANTPLEVSDGVRLGAEGVGLFRTELPFLDARDWPTEADHRTVLRPVLDRLADRTATVRTLDFGHDKLPPFLRTPAGETRGIGLALTAPDALEAQLRAVLSAGRRAATRILLPFVNAPAEVEAVRALLANAIAATGWSGDSPPVGAMIETPVAVDAIDAIASVADFVSLGTNDLVQYALGLDRGLPLAGIDSAADPRVLTLIARAVAVANEHRIPVGICGEAASVPALAALFVGLGVDELSVVPARLFDVHQTVLRLSHQNAAVAAVAALGAGSSAEAVAIGRSLTGDLDRPGTPADRFAML